MNWHLLQTLAQVSVERILNVLPEGFLIAIFAWALLRVLRRQNSGTRFAVWFLALLTVAALPLLAPFSGGRALAMTGTVSSLRPAMTIPAHWALLVFLVWVLGSCLAMMRLIVGLRRISQLRKSCVTVVAVDLDPVVRTTLEAIGSSRSSKSGSFFSWPITVVTSEDVRVPAAIGYWKRTIVLPAWTLRELPPHDLNVILLHEFAHLRRWDDWTNLIQKIVRALFFFHPALWWIEKQLSVEREMACDDAVLAETSNPRGYANCLVSLLEKSLAHRPSQGRWSMAQAAVHRAREASLRLAKILDTNRPVATRIWKPAVGIISAFATACLLTLPMAPQFVAFDRGTVIANSNYAYSTVSRQPSLASSSRPAAVAVPAALRIGESSSLAMPAKVIHARAAASRKLPPAGVVAARLNVPPESGFVVMTNAVEPDPNAEQPNAPPVQTLIFIESTQYGPSGSAVWSVQVWRVTLVNSVRERVARTPAAKST
jgi:bla regulator protein blaR1